MNTTPQIRSNLPALFIMPISAILAAMLLHTAGCSEKKQATPKDQQAFRKGVFIANEGVFRWNNASLSFYNEDSATLHREVYKGITGEALGDVAQSVTCLRDSLLFVVVNNSGKIEVLNTVSGSHLKTIRNLPSPRYLQQVNDSTAWVTDLKATYLTKINLNNLSKAGRVETGKTTEAIVRYQDKVFVSNWSGGNTVQVLSAKDEKLQNKLKVHKEPNSMVLDKHGKLWVLCAGGYNPATAETPALIKIDVATETILQKLTFQADNAYPEKLVINSTGDRLFYLNGGIYALPANASALPDVAVVPSEGRLFYSLYMHPRTGYLWVSNAKDYVQQGEIFIYKSTGTLVKHFAAGINPTDFCALTSL